MGRGSKIWLLFKKPANKNVATLPCPLCDFEPAYGGTTTAIWSHIKSRHKKEFDKLEQESTENETPVSCSEAEKLLSRAFATGMLPFKFAENIEFRHFLDTKPSDFKIPDAKKIQKIIDEEAKSHQESLLRRFRNIKEFCLLTDGYTAVKRGFHFYSCHLAFINEKCEREIQFVTVKSVDGGDHVAISKTICEILESIGLNWSQCSVLTSDGASPLVTLADKHQMEKIHCSCHVLSLVIKNFAEHEKVKEVEKTARKLASHLSRSKDDKSKLKSMADTLKIDSALPLPMPDTRWGGLYLLIRSYIKVYPATAAVSGLQSYLIKGSELSKMEEIADLLQPVYKGLLALELDSSCCSEIIPTFAFIMHQISDNTSELAPVLIDLLKSRLQKYQNNKHLVCAMLLDHRFAYRDRCVSPLKWDEIEKMAECYNSSNANTDVKIDVQPVQKKAKTLTDFVELDNAGSVNEKTYKSELKRYRSILSENRPSFTCPLDFWKSQKENFPILCSIAMKLLSSPASSAVCERSFSKCSDMVRQVKRSRLSVETLNSVLIVSELCKQERIGKDIALMKDGEDEEIEYGSDDDFVNEFSDDE